MISKFFILIRLIFFAFISLIANRKSKIVPKTLLLIRLDAIGDYVLFRNFIEVLKKSDRYKEYKITLLGNTVWQNLSEQLDSDFVNGFIWLDINRFHNYPFYRYRFLSSLAKSGYEVLISSVYSREFLFVDNVVKNANAKEKIGSIGDFSNIKKWQKKISDRYYTKLIETEPKLMFEFDRNKEFFENLLEQKINIKKPIIKLPKFDLNLDLPKEKYAILFIGASAEYRKWSVEKFAKVGRWLKQNLGYEIVLCGANSDLVDAKKFAKFYGNDFIDFVGKTSLIELLAVIYNGNLMITNETSAAHFGVSLEMINLFVIYNGNHLGRFTPYPKNMAPNYRAIYHPAIANNLSDYQKLSNSYGFGSNLDINEISVEQVLEEVKKHVGMQSIN